MQLRRQFLSNGVRGRGLVAQRLSALRPTGAVVGQKRQVVAPLSTQPIVPGDGSKFKMPFKSLMAANRGEIAVRIMRAGNELGLRTVGIFSKEDRFTQHRYTRIASVLIRYCTAPVEVEGAFVEGKDANQRRGWSPLLVFVKVCVCAVVVRDSCVLLHHCMVQPAGLVACLLCRGLLQPIVPTC